MISKKVIRSLLDTPASLVQLLLAVILITMPALAQAPTGYWKFNEGSTTAAYDYFGNAQPARLSDSIRWLNDAKGWAISANRANRDYVSIPAVNLSGTHAVTVAFWVNRTYSTTGESVLFESTKDYRNSATGLSFRADDTACHGMQAALRGNEGTVANCYTPPSSGVWHHFAVVYDKGGTGGDGITLYVDGVVQNPAWNLSSATNTNNFGNDPLYLFSRSGNSEFTSGTLKEFRVYAGALSGGDIQKIYNDSRLAPASPISYVQGNYATPQESQTSVTVPFNAAQLAGDLNVVVVGWNDSTAVVSAVTDSKGNQYTRAAGPTVQSGIASQSIYYAKNIVAAGAGTNTVSVTFSQAANYPDIRILEYSGADPNNPVDVTAANSGNSSNGSSGSATTTNATDLIFGGNVVQTLTMRPGSGFTSRMITQPDGDIAEDEMVSSTGSYAATAPVSPSGPWIMQMVAFRTPSGPVLVSIAVTPANPSITVGGHKQFTATGTYSDGSHQNLTNVATWSSSVPTVATISSAGLTTGVSAGSTIIQAAYGTVHGTTNLTVTTTGSFTMSASPTSLSVEQGHQGTSTIGTAISGGFSSQISLSASGMPSGTTVSFNPSTIPAPGSGNSAMTIVVGANTALGTYPITVTGTGGGVQQHTTVTLTVTDPPPTFTISASPSSLTIAQGSHGSSTITIAIGGGFDSSIALSTSGVPTGTSVSFNPNPVPAPGSGNSTMQITVGSSTAVGTYPITVTGNGGGIQESTTVTLTVTSTMQGATPTLVQHVSCPNSRNTGNSQSPTPDYYCPLPEPAQSGNSIMVGVVAGTGATFTLSDDKLNPYTLVNSVIDSGNNIYVGIYRASNVTAGTRLLHLHRTADTGQTAMSASEYYNVGAVDGSSCYTNSTSTTITAGSITPTTSGDLLWQWSTNGAGGGGLPNSVSSFTKGSQSNVAWQLLGTDLYDGNATQAGIYSSTAAINPTLTSGTAEPFDSCVLALKAASSGNAPSSPFRILHMLHQQMPTSAPNPFSIQFPTSGNLIIASYVSGGSLISSMTSSPSNTWSSTGTAAGGLDISAASQIYYAASANTSNAMAISFTRDNTTSDATYMMYDITGAATVPFDVDSGGQTGNQTTEVSSFTTCTGCLTPSAPNELIIANQGQNWCTSTASSSPVGSLFDAATDTGNGLNGPQSVDQNNGWLHYYDSGTGAITATWTNTCSQAEGLWAGRVAAFK